MAFLKTVYPSRKLTKQYLTNANQNEYVSVKNLDAVKQFFQEAAHQHQQLQRSKRITLRVNQLDLLKVKAKAKKHAIPYQTLLNTLIHQYAEDKTQVVI